MVVISGVAHLGSDPADLFVSHLYAKAVAVENLKGLLEGCIYRSDSPLPILFLELL